MTIVFETSRPSLQTLPKNFLVSLSNYSAISLQGEEQTKYLQGQVTCDVESLEQAKLLHGAHCNAKGKVFSCFRLFNHGEQHLLFQPRSTIGNSLTELKKFGVFAKVEISTTDDLAFFALVGQQAKETLQERFEQLPDSLTPTIHIGSITLVYLAGAIERYLILGDASTMESLIPSLELPVFNNEIWTLLEITEGFPTLSTQSDNEYVPQMLNMQAINGISFTKGCYLGQETVARMQYLGRNKKALFALKGAAEENLPTTIIEKQLGENWRKAGDIISYYIADNKECYLQAVLANDIDSTTSLRIKDLNDSTLSIYDLPYPLTQE